jgi:glycosyltransferase involved in cell wall biosynthesis
MSSAASLKIAFILPENSLAGGVFVTYLQAQALKRRGYDVTIVFVKYNASAGFSHFADLDLKFLELSKIPPDSRFDIAIATWWETFFSLPKVHADKHFYFVQSDERRFYPESDRLNRNWVGLTYSFKQIGVITEAKWIQNFLQTEFGLDVAYAPNGVDNAQFSPMVAPLVPKAGKLRVLIEGSGGLEYKRIDDAFKIAEGVGDIEIWYVCPDSQVKPEWKYDRLFKAVPFKEMAAIYKSCDILIKVSSVEGFFGPPLEMMATGGACIVSNVTGHDEYIRDGENALLINTGDVPAGRAALRKLVSDPTLREKLSKNGLLTAQKLDWNIQHPKFEAAILQLHRDKESVTPDTWKIIETLDQLRRETSKQAQQILKFQRFRYRFAETFFDSINRFFPWIARLFSSVQTKK